MANINLTGKDPDDGNYKRLGPGEGLRDVDHSLFATGFQGYTGLVGATGLALGIQGATGIGETGVQGWTGLRGLRGATGIIGPAGGTGLQGITGIADAGSQGAPGATGFEGATGLQGITGLRGFTGPAGVTGLVLIGTTGAQGITGMAVQGQTGIQGATGPLGATGIQGTTGISITGIQGTTGLGVQGATGLVNYRTLDFQQQTTGVTLLSAIAANTLGADTQTIDFNAWGILANATTLVEITYGNTVITSEFFGQTDEEIAITGSILRTSQSAQTVSLQLVGTNVALVDTVDTGVDVTASQNFAVSLTSAGSGHVIYALLTVKTP